MGRKPAVKAAAAENKAKAPAKVVKEEEEEEKKVEETQSSTNQLSSLVLLYLKENGFTASEKAFKKEAKLEVSPFFYFSLASLFFNFISFLMHLNFLKKMYLEKNRKLKNQSMESHFLRS